MSRAIKRVVFLQAPPSAPAAAKETPQERLKRLMQAQLNKAAQKDSLAVAQRKIQVCACAKSAREQLLLLTASLEITERLPGLLMLLSLTGAVFTAECWSCIA